MDRGNANTSAAIRWISYVLPEGRLTNEELVAEYGEAAARKLFHRAGIEVRALARDEECASDLGVQACRKLFQGGACTPEEIDFLLFCTQTPDYYLPASACSMQEQLRLRKSCGALDINLGCSGFVYGLSVAKGLIESGMASNVVLVNADTLSKVVNPKDRSARALFSDGAAATLITQVESDECLLGPFVFGTDGRGVGNLIVPAGGFRRRTSSETAVEKADEAGNTRSEENLFMNGPEIFNFTIRTVPGLVTQLLEKAGVELHQVDYFVFHQANKFMLEHLRDKLGVPEGKFCINLEHYGNTSSATIPMALELARTDGDVRARDKVLFAGFGVGYSWAACMADLRYWLDGNQI